MREHAEMNFGLLRVSGPTPEARSQSPFEPRDRALDLRPLAVLKFGKPPVHLSAVRSFCPAASTSSVQRDNRASNAQVLSGVGVVVFGVVASIGQHTVNPQSPAGTVQHRGEQRSVLTRAIRDQDFGKKMAGIMARQRQLGPAMQGIAFLAGTPSIMRRAMPGLQARGIDACFLFAADHSTLGGVLKDCVEQFVKPTFFNRRCCAL